MNGVEAVSLDTDPEEGLIMPLGLGVLYSVLSSWGPGAVGIRLSYYAFAVRLQPVLTHELCSILYAVPIPISLLSYSHPRHWMISRNG